MTSEIRLLLTEVEAAKALRLSQRTLRKARNDGLLRYILIGRAVRYTMDDLQAYIDSLGKVNVACLLPPQPSKPRKAAKRGSAVIVPFHLRAERKPGRDRL